MKSNAALARNDEDDIQSQIEHLRNVRDRVRRSAPGPKAADSIDIDALPFGTVTSEDLHRSLTAQYDALGASEQLVIREIVADHRRLAAYQGALDRLLKDGKADIRILERLESVRETASRAFHRGLDTLRLLKVAATPIVVQAAARDGGGGRPDVRVVGGRESSRRPRPIRLRETRG